MTDTFDSLKQDHRRVEQLFEQFEASFDRDVARQICNELSIHAVLEEETLYGLLRAKVSSGMADEARDEHQQAKDLINRIELYGADDEELKDLMRQLKESVAHHVEEEENEVFPAMEKALPETIGAMGNDIERRREQLLEAAAAATTSAAVGEKPAASGRGV
jgi:hemerythrin superfamily protein